MKDDDIKLMLASVPGAVMRVGVSVGLIVFAVCSKPLDVCAVCAIILTLSYVNGWWKK